MTKRINGEVYASMVKSAAANISNKRQTLNELNVFPVPDGDTGTNMALTIGSAAAELFGSAEKKTGKVAETVAAALLRGARGNSGVILSLLFRGFSRSIRDFAEIGAAEFAEGLNEGVEAAYKAVMKPAEGTILTVSRVSSQDARQAVEAGEQDVLALIQTALESAEAALKETVNQNPVLQKAGVVDSGAMGYVFLLEGMLAALRGEPFVSSEAETKAANGGGSILAAFDTDSITFAYCTEYIVNRDGKGGDPLRLRAFFESLGDSVVVVDDESIIKVHVHTNNPGLAIEEGLKFGALSAIKIENMREQHTQSLIKSDTSASLLPPRPVTPEKEFGFVAVAAGKGISSVFRDLGVDEIVEGGQTMNPSTNDILAAIERVPANVVFVLPNNKNIIMAAEQAEALSSRELVVLPTTSVPQGITAMLSFDESMSRGQNVESMTGALSRVRTGQLTYAARDSLYDGKKIRMGEHIALIDGKLGGYDHDFAKAARAMVKRLKVKDSAFITVFTGADATEERTSILSDAIRKDAPEHVELGIIDGGQPVYSYIVSVE